MPTSEKHNRSWALWEANGDQKHLTSEYVCVRTKITLYLLYIHVTCRTIGDKIEK